MAKRRAPNNKQRHQRRPKDRPPSSSQKQRKPHVALSGQTGTFEKTRKGFGFIIFDNPSHDDLFVPPRDADNYFHGDRLRVTTNSRGEIERCDVLSHRTQEIVGVLNGRRVFYENRKNSFEVTLNEATQAQNGEWVRVKLEYPKRPGIALQGKVLEIYGKEIPASADLHWISSEFGVTPDHPAAAIEQAEREKQNFEKELSNTKRTDLRHIPFMTIDGADARDFDDAVFVEKKNDRFVLWVAIADVSHYVTEGSALDESAFNKSTSVYFPEKAFHMLPSALSEEVCSLKPHVPRLAFTARMEIDANGKKLKTELFESIIKSHRRGVYEEIQEEWLENKNNPSYALRPAFELYKVLQKHRTHRGSIDFELPESFIDVDKSGEPIRIKRRDRVDTHRLIEEFMIVANESVSEWMIERKGHFIYRIHEFPSTDSMLSFQKIATGVGVSFFIPREAITKPYADFIRTVQTHPAQMLLNSMFLRSLKQARYSTENPGHFGLASTAYSHFTSPIRRYPDLIVHRLLRQMLRKIPQKNNLVQKLEEICQHTSQRERIASDAERESRRIKQVRMLKKYLGESFDGIISGASQLGLYVQIDDPFTEGTIPLDSLSTHEEYEFDSSRMCVVGKRSKKILRVGDKVRVKVAAASLQTRTVTLEPEEFYPSKHVASKSKGQSPSQNQVQSPPQAKSQPPVKPATEDTPRHSKKGGPQAFLDRIAQHKRTKR